MARARCCCCIPLPISIYVLAPVTFAISLLLSTLTSYYLAHYHETISKVSTILLSVYVVFTLLLSLSSILGLAGAIRHRAMWVKIYAELLCMNWFIGVGLGVGHIVKTWKNKKALLKMCEEAMRKHEDGGAGGGAGDEDATDTIVKDATHCLHAFRWINAFVIIGFILINVLILYFIIVAFRAAKHMETEVPAVTDGYTYPPDTWANDSRGGGGRGGAPPSTRNHRQRSNTINNAALSSHRNGGVFQGPSSSSGDEKHPSGTHHHRSQSVASGLSVVTANSGSSGRKASSGYPADDRYPVGTVNTPTQTREKSNSVSSNVSADNAQAAAGQPVPLGVGQGVYVSRYTSKNSMEADAGAWK